MDSTLIQPVLDTLTAVKDTVDTLAVAAGEPERFTGILRVDNSFNHNLLISILLLFCIAITWHFLLQKESVIGWFKKLGDNIFSDMHKVTVRDQIGEGIVLLMGLYGISLLCCEIVDSTAATWQTSLKVWGFSLIFLLLKIIAMRLYFGVCFPKKSGLMIYKYLALNAGFGFSCLLVFIGLYFTQDYLKVVWYVISGLTLISYFCSLSYVLIKYFFNRLELIFHFILYLCSLELLPIFLVLKVAL